MLLSTALPKNGELEAALDGATYLLERRSGFVASDRYADEWRKRGICMCLPQAHAL